MGTSACRIAATPLGTVCWPMNNSPFPATKNSPPAVTASRLFRPVGRQYSVRLTA